MEKSMATRQTAAIIDIVAINKNIPVWIDQPNPKYSFNENKLI